MNKKKKKKRKKKQKTWNDGKTNENMMKKL